MKRRILIVDDDKDLSFIISEMLENHGYSVSCAESGETAFAKLADETFHLRSEERRVGKECRL